MCHTDTATGNMKLVAAYVSRYLTWSTHAGGRQAFLTSRCRVMVEDQKYQKVQSTQLLDRLCTCIVNVH